MALVEDKSIDWTDLGGNVQRKIMAHNPEMMIVKVQMKAGAVGAMHQHFHTQASYIAGGVFDITIDGITNRLKDGDVYFVPSNLLHGALCIEDGILVDAFSPAREDFL